MPAFAEFVITFSSPDGLSWNAPHGNSSAAAWATHIGYATSSIGEQHARRGSLQ